MPQFFTADNDWDHHLDDDIEDEIVKDEIVKDNSKVNQQELMMRIEYIEKMIENFDHKLNKICYYLEKLHKTT